MTERSIIVVIRTSQTTAKTITTINDDVNQHRQRIRGRLYSSSPGCQERKLFSACVIGVDGKMPEIWQKFLFLPGLCRNDYCCRQHHCRHRSYWSLHNSFQRIGGSTAVTICLLIAVTSMILLKDANFLAKRWTPLGRVFVGKIDSLLNSTTNPRTGFLN